MSEEKKGAETSIWTYEEINAFIQKETGQDEDEFPINLAFNNNF